MSHPRYKIYRIRRRWRDERWKEEADRWYDEEIRRMFGHVPEKVHQDSIIKNIINKLKRKEVNTD